MNNVKSREEEILEFASIKAIEYSLGERFKDAIIIGARWADKNPLIPSRWDDLLDARVHDFEKVRMKLTAKLNLATEALKNIGCLFGNAQCHGQCHVCNVLTKMKDKK